MNDTIQTIRRSSRLFLSGTFLSRVSGMFRDMSMAYVFGTQPSIAAFMVAFRFAHLLRRLFGEGALQSAFVPEFEALRHKSEKGAFVFFQALMGVLTLFLIVLIAISCGALALFLRQGEIHPDNQEIIFLTLVMLPSLLFICLFGLNASLLQCEKRYFIPSVAPVAFNAIWIAAVFMLKGMPAEQAMPWLSFGVVIACLCQWLMTVPQTWKSLKSFIIDRSFWQTARESFSELRGLTKPLFLGVLGVAASQINNAVDSLFARVADPEGPALLWYAIRIQQLPLALFGISIAGAILPPLSRAIKGQKVEEYRRFLHDALSSTWLFMIPLTGCLFAMGDSSVQLIYGRGDFGAESAIQTTYCLWAYGIGLVPAALVLVLAPACYAQSDYRLPAVASFGSMLLNIVLNSWFILGLGWGAVSVAIATSISAWVNFFFLGWRLSALSPKSYKHGSAMLVATLLATWGTIQGRIYFQQNPFFSDLLFSSSFLNQVMLLGGQGAIFALIVGVCLGPKVLQDPKHISQ